MRKYNLAWLIMLLFTLTFIPACGGGGGGDGGGGTVRPPVSINFDEFVDGDMGAYTKETFTFTILADTYISVELYGVRLNQPAWTDSTFNAPIIALVDQSTPGGTTILKHNIDAPFWGFGYRDTEIPLYHLKYTGIGTPQSYSIVVTRKNPGVAGAIYKLRVNDVTSDISGQFGTTYFEQESLAGNTNDDTTNAESIGNTDAVVFGHYNDNTDGFGNPSPDFYSVDVTATAIEPVVISCFEIVSHRNGMYTNQINPDYSDLELVLHDPLEAAVNLVDDAFFIDPQICRKVSTLAAPETFTYFVNVHETTAADPGVNADYIMKYTEERINSLDIEQESGTNSNVFPDPIAYGNLVEGNISVASQKDWYAFTAQRGDIIKIREFEAGLADDSNATISIELHSTTLGSDLIPFNGPTDVPGFSGLYPQMTTTSLLTETSGTYYVMVKEENAADNTYPKKYSFIIEREKSSRFEQNPLNDDDLNADSFDLDGRASGVIDAASDIDFFEIDSTELGNLGVVDGDLVAVHIYAGYETGVYPWKAYDSTGYGSTLEPKLTIYDNTVSTPITTSTYVQDSETEATSEGVRAPYPTLTATFVANPGTIPAYLISVGNGGIYDGTSPSYLIEVVNLGQ